MNFAFAKDGTTIFLPTRHEAREENAAKIRAEAEEGMHLQIGNDETVDCWKRSGESPMELDRRGVPLPHERVPERITRERSLARYAN